MAHFLRKKYPECRLAKDITPKMVDDFIAAALERRLATGTLGRYQSGIRKLDEAMRHLKLKPTDAPPLLPTMKQGGKRGFRAETSTEIRRACSALAIKSLGTHAFRKRNAQNHHARLIAQGLSDAEARMQVAKHLGHNRVNVVSESYVPPQDREV